MPVLSSSCFESEPPGMVPSGMLHSELPPRNPGTCAGSMNSESTASVSSFLPQMRTFALVSAARKGEMSLYTLEKTHGLRRRHERSKARRYEGVARVLAIEGSELASSACSGKDSRVRFSRDARFCNDRDVQALWKVIVEHLVETLERADRACRPSPRQAV